MTVKGDAELTPRRGMGYGALAGVLVAGAVATQFEVPSSTDLLFIDLSALLGGLAGAALGTPVLVSQEASPTRDRIWLAGVMAGTLAGAGISYWVTQRDEPEPPVALGRRETSLEEGRGFRVRPQLGWMGMPLGVGLSGEW
jgi:ABC-type Fe3+-siderophore transport system permease subunit